MPPLVREDKREVTGIIVEVPFSNVNIPSERVCVSGKRTIHPSTRSNKFTYADAIATTAATTASITMAKISRLNGPIAPVLTKRNVLKMLGQKLTTMEK